MTGRGVDFLIRERCFKIQCTPPYMYVDMIDQKTLNANDNRWFDYNSNIFVTVCFGLFPFNEPLNNILSYGFYQLNNKKIMEWQLVTSNFPLLVSTIYRFHEPLEISL